MSWSFASRGQLSAQLAQGAACPAERRGVLADELMKGEEGI